MVGCDSMTGQNSALNEKSNSTLSPTARTSVSTPTTPIETNCGESSFRLLAGQTVNAGTVVVANSADHLTITVTTTGGWYLNQLHVAVGASLSDLPVNKAGNPVPGQYPYSYSFNTSDHDTVAVVTLNLSDLGLTTGSTVYVAVHTDVFQVDSNNFISRTETAWGEGTRFVTKGNWGMYLTYTIAACTVNTNYGCSFSQGYWFAKPNLVWPGTVTIGGFTYSQAEGDAIWNTSNKGGIPDSKAGFLQVAAIKLSGSSVAGNAPIWSDVTTIENWLSTLGKLSPTNLPTGNQAVKDAAGRIGTWIDANDCSNQ